MDFLAYLWVTVSLFFTSIFGGVSDLQNFSHPPVQPTEQVSITTSAPSIIARIGNAGGDDSVWSKDAQHVYYWEGGTTTLTKADASTFVPRYGSTGNLLGFEDKNYIYDYNNTVIQVKGSPTSTITFKLGLATSYTQGPSGVYYKGILLPGSDPSTFEMLGGASHNGTAVEYDKDKNHLYAVIYYPQISVLVVSGADIATFKTGGDGITYDAQDKNHKYLNGQIVQ